MAETPQKLPPGFPSERDYRAVLGSAEFKDLDAFSDRFLSTNGRILGRHGRRWGRDPLHQWSRQWEYPFVSGRLDAAIGRDADAIVLDAGSGVTFFPYYLCERNASLKIHCCDSDAALRGVFEKIRSPAAGRVEFFQADIRSIPSEDSHYDAVYCVSVLEHTEGFEGIVGEFHRVIKPGGKLLVTFDVSLDGTRDISPARATRLIEALMGKFHSGEAIDSNLASRLTAPGIFTTASAAQMNGRLLPWRFPSILYRLQSLLSGKGLVSWPPLLTVCCLDLTKPLTQE
ncbi:MAG: class I SAM-dependent methyltransferase [Syntrophaceae bacterium]|nr:class I SAM-dependent methyltransferase [Syntrophaceae bacterium]